MDCERGDVLMMYESVYVNQYLCMQLCVLSVTKSARRAVGEPQVTQRLFLADFESTIL